MENEARPLNYEEREQLVAELRRLSTDAKPPVREAQATDPDVPAAMDAVFEKHRELLQRLAQ